MRVVATRIDWDGTMQRRVVDAAHCSDGPRWEELARRAIAAPPPYRPVPGAVIYQVSLDGDREVLVAEHDLDGPLLDLVTAVMAMGEEISGHSDGPRFRLSSRGTFPGERRRSLRAATDSPVRL
jgi:hypothetical protein